MAKAVRVIVSGRVQGVWFRASTRDQARVLGVTGYVRNCSDGSVEIVAAGEGQQVDELVQWAGQGPPHAIVSQVEVTEVAAPQHYASFDVVY